MRRSGRNGRSSRVAAGQRREPAIGSTRRALTLSLRSSGLSAALAIPLSLVYVPFVLDRLDISSYGVWATVSALLLFAGLADGGVGTEVARRVAEASGHGDLAAEERAVREGITVLSVVGALVAATGIAGSSALVNVVFTDLPAEQRDDIRLLLIAVILQLSVSLVLSACFAVLQGLQRTDYGNYGQVVGQALTVVVSMVGLTLGFGLAALFVGNLVGAVSGWLARAYGVRRCRPTFRLLPARVRPRAALNYFGLSAVIILGSLSNIVDFQLDKVLLSRYVGGSAAGTYQIGTTLAVQARSAALLPIGLLMAGTAALYATDRGKLARLEHLLGGGTHALTAVLLGGLATLCPVFIPLWLGQGYGDAILATQLLAIALLVNCWTAPWYFYAVGRGWYGDIAAAAAANAVVNGLASFLLTRELGIVGALLGSILGNVLGLAAFWALLRRHDRQARLRLALRPTLVLLPVAGAFSVLVTAAPGWPGFCALIMGWLVSAAAALLVTRSVPIRLEWSRARPGLRLTEP